MCTTSAQILEKMHLCWCYFKIKTRSFVAGWVSPKQWKKINTLADKWKTMRWHCFIFSGTCFHSSLSSFYIQVTSESALNATNKQPIFYCLFVYRSTASAVVVFVFVVPVCDASFWVQLIIVINNKRTAKNKHSKSKARDDRVGDLLNAIHELISTQCTNKTPTKSIIKMYLKRSTVKNHRSCGELAFVAKLAYNDRLLISFSEFYLNVGIFSVCSCFSEREHETSSIALLLMIAHLRFDFDCCCDVPSWSP